MVLAIKVVYVPQSDSLSVMEFKRWQLIPMPDEGSETSETTVQAPVLKLMTELTQPQRMSNDQVVQYISETFKSAELREKALTLWRLSLSHSVSISVQNQNVLYSGPFLEAKQLICTALCSLHSFRLAQFRF